jgi:hypothetical protein
MDAWQKAQTKWRQDMKAWEDSLTPAQRAELSRRRDLEERARREKEKSREEEFERSRRLPLPTDGYTWQAAAAKRRLGAAAVAQLGRDKIAYGPSVKQSFTPYFGGPVFITSDSLLNAFHVLFEDSFREWELRNCGELRKHLEIVFQQARENLRKSPYAPSDTAPAWRQAQVAIGPALCLLGSPIDLFDDDVRPEIQRQLVKIRAADAAELPDWLAPGEPKFMAVDYRACKPIGFYAGDEKLADYFRAVRWLQSVPFRANRNAELAAIGMLGYGLDRAYRSGGQQFLGIYSVILGVTDTRGLPEAAYDFQNFFSNYRGTATWTDALRAKKRWELGQVMSHDDWMKLGRDELPPNADGLLANVVYHIIPAYRVWDSALFQTLADRQLEPEGLAVAVALGSTFAGEHMQNLTTAQVQAAAKTVDGTANQIEGRHERSLYTDYLDVLRTLNVPPPSDAPAFVRSDAWRAKTTQTILSSWAQMRHTFSLQAKRSEYYLGMFILPPGFVEPNPEFFARISDLIERSRGLFETDRDRWDTLASVSRKLEALAHKELRQQQWSPQEEEFLKAYGERIAYAMGYDGNSYEVPNDDAPRWAEAHHNDLNDAWLAICIGRPRMIYVLYPWNGMEILCQGSVLPYYEYTAKERLTDAEWKQRLDSSQPPESPEWMQPYLGKTPPVSTGPGH